MKILVTGGAGYIGSFMVKRLINDSHEVVIVDSLERGNEKAIDKRATFLKGNLLENEFLSGVFSNHEFECVMHFAGYISVAESMQDPGLYFKNNVFSTLMLLESMNKHNIKNIIFSSTGTVYGDPTMIPMIEEYKTQPGNPYAESKLMVENILNWYQKVRNIKYGLLRYFNAAGGALDGGMGEHHIPEETHLIPNTIKAALRNSELSLFGNDYDTPDGTCIRDYIHVLDLVEAHILSLKNITESQKSHTYNVGTGNGHSNKEVIEMVKKISGVDFPVVIKPRRSGDSAATVANVTKIKQELNFVPKYSDLETIVSSAWKWHKSHDNV